jgi:Tfp pilus assembly protein PilV
MRATAIRQLRLSSPQPAPRRQSGLTILELVIALLVMTVGMGGLLVLFTMAISTNNRNRVDTHAVLVSQMFLEQIATSSASSFTITDCATNSVPVTTAAGGAALNASEQIDWTQASSAVPSGYLQTYVSCAGAGNTQITFEIRWNITSPAVTGLTGTRLISVSSRPRNAAANGLYIAVPTTLRTIVTN